MRDGTGTPGLVVRLSSEEVALLRTTSAQVAALLEGGVPDRGADPLRDRLFPRAYLDPTEEEAEADWQAAVHPDLVAAKAGSLNTLLETLEVGRTYGRRTRVEIRLSAQEVERWVGALNDLRLVVGTLLGVRDDDPDPDPATDPERPPLRVAYLFLTALQGELVDWLSGRPDEDAPA